MYNSFERQLCIYKYIYMYTKNKSFLATVFDSLFSFLTTVLHPHLFIIAPKDLRTTCIAVLNVSYHTFGGALGDYICVHKYVYMYIYQYIHICICMYIYIYIYIYMNIEKFICIYTTCIAVLNVSYHTFGGALGDCICIHICIYIYVHVYIYIYIYLYICIYI
jgi:cobalamin synthase